MSDELSVDSWELAAAFARTLEEAEVAERSVDGDLDPLVPMERGHERMPRLVDRHGIALVVREFATLSLLAAVLHVPRRDEVAACGRPVAREMEGLADDALDVGRRPFLRRPDHELH